MEGDRWDKGYSVGEEIAHSVTHGVGLLLSIAGLVILVVYAALRGDVWHVVGASTFGATGVMLYTASTLYHALPWPRAKRIFRLLDHSAIYLLIAGTYTPFCLVSLRGGLGWSLFGSVWALAVVGVLVEIFTRRRYPWISIVLYLGLGWLIVIAIRPLASALDTGGLVLLFAGGLAYSLGVVFYVLKLFPYHHAVWHLFVVAGTVCHFFAVLFYVIPRG